MSEADRTQGTEGRLLAGRYSLDGMLGRGGMGTVWRARDEMLGRVVAIKELRFPSSVDDDEKRRLITRTLREAKAIARIRSSGAVTVFDVVEEDDRPWIVMELVEGRSLADVVRDDGPLTPRRAAEVGLAVLDVLRAAHRASILHRDVKPSNVLMADDGRVVLTDFGIAHVEGDPSVTSTGMLVGAPSYISPERARGQKPGPPSDLWSLGGLLYAAVEGVPPYDKSTAIATLTAVMTEALDPPKNAGGLEKVIYGLLTKDADKRLDDAGARAMLNELLNAPDAAAPKPPPAPARTQTMALPQPDAALPVALTKGESPSRPAGAPHPTGTAPRASLTDVVPKRTLVIIAVVVALAILGTVLAIALSGGDGDKSAGGSGSSASTDVAGTDKGQGAADTSGKGGTDRPNTEKADPGSSGEDGGKDGLSGGGKDAAKSPGAAVPDGYTRVVKKGFHFSMAMPEGWSTHDIGNYSGGKRYYGGSAFPRLQVDYNSSPKPDAVRAWEDGERASRSSMRDYHRIGIKSVKWRDYVTVADWNFEQKLGGRTVRVLNRGFNADGKHGFAIVVTCEKDKWNDKECRTLRETAFSSFRIID